MPTYDVMSLDYSCGSSYERTFKFTWNTKTPQWKRLLKVKTLFQFKLPYPVVVDL